MLGCKILSVHVDAGNVLLALIAFDQHKIRRRHAGEQLSELGLSFGGFLHERPPFGPHEKNLPGAGRAEAIAVLARAVDVGEMMGTLDCGNRSAPAHEAGQNLFDERCLANAGRAEKAYREHVSSLRICDGNRTAGNSSRTRANAVAVPGQSPGR